MWVLIERRPLLLNGGRKVVDLDVVNYVAWVTHKVLNAKAPSDDALLTKSGPLSGNRVRGYFITPLSP